MREFSSKKLKSLSKKDELPSKKLESPSFLADAGYKLGYFYKPKVGVAS
jgi:hypothetical protein